MANKTKFGFGSSENIEQALQDGKINARDILLLDEDTDNPKIGWISKSGTPVILKDEMADLSEVEADVAALEAELATKANAEDIAELETVIANKVDADEVDAKYEEIKYEISDVPVGTLVDYGDKEIRVMCPKDSVFTKQAVGTGGDANSYYMTFRTYVPNDNVVGYKEHLGDKVDAEILTDFKTDKYGRRYQPTWLALAKYDEETDAWTYYGANSTKDKYIGWNYQIDFYDANGVMIASDCVRINLSNEDCHSSIKPYYGVSEMTEVETKIDEAVNTANAYTDAQIEAKIAEVASAYEVIEF